MANAEQQLYEALVNAGLNMNQAAGVMGNAEFESSFNPEAQAIDSNGKLSTGFIQWNAGSYPDAPGLRTGNPTADLAAQVNYLLHNTHNINLGLQGSSATQVAGNFARYVEVCQGCQPGGSSYNQRVAAAQRIFNDAQSGNWGSGAGVSGGSGGNAGTASGQPASFLSDPLGSILSALGLGSWKDLFQRLGLILLGAALILIGVRMLGTASIKSMISAPNTPAKTGKEVTEKAGKAGAAGATGGAVEGAEVVAAV